VTDFGEIYTEYFSGVYKYVLTLCRDEAIAEEVTQETFFKAIQHIDRFNGSCRLYVWLCQIAKNTYFSLSRKQKRISPYAHTDINNISSSISPSISQSISPGMSSGILPGISPGASSDVEKDYLDKEAAMRLHVLLHNLNEPYKEVFTLRVFGELPFSQIGELFGKTAGWARLVFYRAKKQLQEAMK
jgi:RNA polymerase sigma factor (sigma-70 family)